MSNSQPEPKDCQLLSTEALNSRLSPSIRCFRNSKIARGSYSLNPRLPPETHSPEPKIATETTALEPKIAIPEHRQPLNSVKLPSIHSPEPKIATVILQPELKIVIHSLNSKIATEQIHSP
ncbi:hypothetical protein AVEN_72561-1 [Araneus ventricosus]|uniref:Uncharacterized protein n=1 Tax=Araneus ventricosus TaxID=182803 RepID=A0A4Y2MJ77_ARAVE|nr:hypothetical protein AVEN_72561-1 [Araneus ventricosus]